MPIPVLFVIALGLSMDAFAVSVCKGLAAGGIGARPALACGAYFGGFQALMPLLGWRMGVQFQELIAHVDHWIAFGLLGVLGLKMIWEARGDERCVGNSLTAGTMVPLALATSLDALALGVTFAFLQVEILPAVAFIGGTTFVLSAAGVYLGAFFGSRWRGWPERLGGAVLILMGLHILLEHLSGA